MSKITEFDIGDIVTRKERAKCKNHSDGSYMGTKMRIIELTDEYAQVEFVDGMFENKTHGFTGPWLEGWTLISKKPNMISKYQTKTIKEPIIEQLMQLTRLTWDGDLISKKDRSKLVGNGLAKRIEGGYNIITEKGVEYLTVLGFISP